jgi:hypothetical protein
MDASRLKKNAGGQISISVQARAILEKLENGQEGAALKEVLTYAEKFLCDIFGNQAKNADLIEMAFRIDQKLGAFVWLLFEIKARLDSEVEFRHSKDPREVQRLLVLLVVYFLATS